MSYYNIVQYHIVLLYSFLSYVTLFHVIQYYTTLCNNMLLIISYCTTVTIYPLINNVTNMNKTHHKQKQRETCSNEIT